MTSFPKKLATGFMAALTVAALLLVLGNSGTLTWFPPIVVFSLVGICLLSGVIYPFVWQHREHRRPYETDRIYALLFAVIRYAIAFNLASFGWKKLFGLQFVVPPELAGRPMNQQPGETLTWYYFGYSPAFGTLIALTQLAGAYLLLYRKTFLLSCVVLFALMLNIALVDVFYQMNAGALVQAVVLTQGLLFLLLIERRKLIAVFVQSNSILPVLPVRHQFIKNALRLSALLLSLLFVYCIAKP